MCSTEFNFYVSVYVVAKTVHSSKLIVRDRCNIFLYITMSTLISGNAYYLHSVIVAHVIVKVFLDDARWGWTLLSIDERFVAARYPKLKKTEATQQNNIYGMFGLDS
ncbi:hypothetical protein RIF29_32511 [Crotalaria pallida]|uniref:Uncharacterized protein n=1 Tax=Crotalaria pallida TaxID=3830 RepID=A0AAN9EJ09_CROPI